MPIPIQESIMKAPLKLQQLPPAAAKLSYILITFGGMMPHASVIWTSDRPKPIGRRLGCR